MNDYISAYGIVGTSSPLFEILPWRRQGQALGSGWQMKEIMKKFVQTYPDFEFMQQLVAQIPWCHNCIMIDKVKDDDERI